MSDEILVRRRAERDRLISRAREHVDRLSARRQIVAAVVVGSVARGDFNVWSDIDVIVVMEMLPDRAPDRLALVNEDAPTGVQVVGYTPEEFLHALRRGNRMTIEAVERGELLCGSLPMA